MGTDYADIATLYAFVLCLALVVYRGCANDGNLPWGVDPNTQCQYQGDSKSLWWFCEGDLCNAVSSYN